MIEESRGVILLYDVANRFSSLHSSSVLQVSHLMLAKQRTVRCAARRRTGALVLRDRTA